MSEWRTDWPDDAGPILPGTRRNPLALLLPPVGAGAAMLILSACMPSASEVRRETYLDCARAQGVTVRDGTIVTRSAAELKRLDACRAVPR